MQVSSILFTTFSPVETLALFILVGDKEKIRFLGHVESLRNLPILSNSSIICILRLRGIILGNLGYNIYSNGPVCCLPAHTTWTAMSSHAGLQHQPSHIDPLGQNQR